MEDRVGDAELAQIVQDARRLNPLDTLAGQPQLGRRLRGEAADGPGVARRAGLRMSSVSASSRTAASVPACARSVYGPREEQGCERNPKGREYGGTAPARRPPPAVLHDGLIGRLLACAE